MFDKQQLDQLYRYCYSLLGHESNAYDLLQSSLEKYLCCKTTIKNPQTYMKQIIRNSFIDFVRKASHRDHDLYEEDQGYMDYDVKTLESIMIDRSMVEQVMAFLTPSEREIVHLWAVEGYSTREIADWLGIPKGTILSKIHRLRIKLKQQFPESVELNQVAL